MHHKMGDRSDPFDGYVPSDTENEVMAKEFRPLRSAQASRDFVLRGGGRYWDQIVQPLQQWPPR